MRSEITDHSKMQRDVELKNNFSPQITDHRSQIREQKSENIKHKAETRDRAQNKEGLQLKWHHGPAHVSGSGSRRCAGKCAVVNSVSLGAL